MIQYTCPHCRKVVTVAERADLPTRPFCCARCQQIDLGKWLNGEYVVSDHILPIELPPNGANPTDPDNPDRDVV
ncbi:MAG: DNA gyrase inhibitor YacG [Phycisphaerales bacterium]|nr:DNA gyrase inhibitor YacG [Phycisphaerales bacterium]